MPKDEPAGEKTSLVEQGTFAGTKAGKKRVCNIWKKGQMTQEEYKDIVRSCRENIRKAKAQLELNLASAVKSNKKYFHKYTNNRKEGQKECPSFIGCRGNSNKG